VRLAVVRTGSMLLYRLLGLHCRVAHLTDVAGQRTVTCASRASHRFADSITRAARSPYCMLPRTVAFSRRTSHDEGLCGQMSSGMASLSHCV
jgi:hypothetical protein